MVRAAARVAASGDLSSSWSTTSSTSGSAPAPITFVALHRAEPPLEQDVESVATPGQINIDSEEVLSASRGEDHAAPSSPSSAAVPSAASDDRSPRRRPPPRLSFDDAPVTVSIGRDSTHSGGVARATQPEDLTDEQLARQLQAREYASQSFGRAAPLVVGQPLSGNAAVGRTSQVASGTPTGMPPGGSFLARRQINFDAGVVWVEPTLEEARIIRMYHYSATVQCLAMILFLFTFLTILYPTDYQIIVALLSPFGLVGVVGARRLDIKYLTVYQGFLVVDFCCRIVVALLRAKKVEERERNGVWFWLFFFAMVVLYVFGMTSRLKMAIEEIPESVLDELRDGDMSCG